MNEGDVIFLSASVPVRKGWVEDARPTEIEEAIVSVARAVFARKGRLLFGGHPSVSPLVAAVAGEYFAADPERRVRPVVTFQSRFYEGRLPDETTDMVKMGWSAIEWTPRQFGTDDQDSRASLKLMRDCMLLGSGTPPEVIDRNRLSPPKAMIAIGGMNGVRDEAFEFLRNRQNWGFRPLPGIYLFRSGGGAAARLLEGDTTGKRLWPDEQRDSNMFETLTEALRNGGIIDVESAWRAQYGDNLPEGIPFEPYAVMAQWLLDTLPAPSR
jgi:hypothetical protein